MMVKVIKEPLVSIFNQKQPLWLNLSGIEASNVFTEIGKVFEKCVIFQPTHLPIYKPHMCTRGWIYPKPLWLLGQNGYKLK